MTLCPVARQRLSGGMDAGKPDKTEIEGPQRSLAEGLREAARARLRRRSAPREAVAAPFPAGRRAAVIVALLIAAGPLATLAGANLLAAQARSQAARLQAQLAPRAAQERAVEQARSQMGAALLRPMLGVTLEAVARALPANATLLRAGRTRDGALELEISAPDPDQLRTAMRALPGIGTFRNTGQRQGDAGMIVSLRADAR